jgi:hypothetical protein
MRSTPRAWLIDVSQIWNTNPMTLYCRNHATTDARPTVCHGPNADSRNVIRQACISCDPSPVFTWALFAIIAIFSRGIVT